MNCFDMNIQITFLSKWLIAYQTSEWFSIVMNCFDMNIQNTIMSKWFLANHTFQDFHFFFPLFATDSLMSWYKLTNPVFNVKILDSMLKMGHSRPSFFFIFDTVDSK